MRISNRILILFTTIFSILFAVISLSIFQVSRNHVKANFRERIKKNAESIAAVYSRISDKDTAFLQILETGLQGGLESKSVKIFSAGGATLYQYNDKSMASPHAESSIIENAKTKGFVFFFYGGREVCIIQSLVNRTEIYVLVAARDETGQHYISDLKYLLFIFFPLSVCLTIIAGYLFSRQLVKPIKETIHEVNLISSSNLSHRLYADESDDELSMLKRTFNDLLDRLEESFIVQRRFISNASHELSTPLTSISSQLEVILLKERDGESYRKAIRSVLEDVKNLQALTKSLLEFAKAGSQGSITIDEIRIDEVLIDVHSDITRHNKAFHIDLQFGEYPEDEQECKVYGNYHLLYSAFKNLLENGCKYSADHTVRAELLFLGDTIKIEFANKSDVIRQDELDRLFEPFYRSRNVAGQKGSGLGLTLTKRIIRLHKGKIDVESSEEKGTRFTITLPTITKRIYS